MRINLDGLKEANKRLISESFRGSAKIRVNGVMKIRVGLLNKDGGT